MWPDPETSWRATLRDALGYSHDLAFDNYLPAAQLFGDQPDSLDGLREPVLGKTVDEVKKAYKDELTGAGQGAGAHAAADRVGPPSRTRITLDRRGRAASARARVRMPWRGHPEARDTLFELFKHKWGEPKERRRTDGKTTLVFRDDDPHVEVREDTEHGAWHSDRVIK